MKTILMVLALMGFTMTAQAQSKKLIKQTPAASSSPTYSSSSPSTFTSSGNSQKREFDLNLATGFFKSYKAGKDTVNELGVGGTLLFLIQDQFQLGGEIAILSISGAASTTAAGGASTSINGTQTTFVAVGAYNFTRNLEESFYAKLGLGLFPGRNDKAEIENKFGFYAGIGKRFELFNKINYKPELRINKVGSEDISFTIYLLNTSIFF